jgi:hypothetical protein
LGYPVYAHVRDIDLYITNEFIAYVTGRRQPAEVLDAQAVLQRSWNQNSAYKTQI